MGYGVENIQHLDTREAFREEVNVYLGSKGIEGCYQALKEIINNSTDEAMAGYGNKIEIIVNEKDNIITVKDYGRGVPFGIVGDRNTLVAIYTEAHTGGKFDKNAYKTSSGLHGLGGTAVCLTSEFFEVISRRNGTQARAYFEKGILKDYKEDKCNEPNGTIVTFKPDTNEVFVDADKNFDYKRICEDTENLAFLNKGIHFIVTSGKETKDFYSENGISDFIKKNIAKPLMKNVIITTAKDSSDEVEVAFIWTGGQNKEYTFVNGLMCPEGGSPITGIRRKLTTKIKSLSGKSYDPEIVRKGFVVAVNCKVVKPSFENQTKNKINNKNLATLAGKALDEGLDKFANSPDFESILALIAQYDSAEKAAERARDTILNQTKKMDDYRKQKVAFMDKLHDAEHLGPDSVLCLCEGQSAANAVLIGRDTKTTGVMELRGKMLNGLKEQNEEKYFNNHEIELLMYALGININSYNPKNLRYGKIYICVDADDDGFHIALLILANLKRICPRFLQENRVYWLRCPLFLEYNKTEKLINWYYTNSEYEAAKAKGKITGKIERAKGLGLLEEPELTATMFSKNGGQRLEQIIYSEEGISQLCALMGEDVAPRKEFCMSRIDFSKYNIG